MTKRELLGATRRYPALPGVTRRWELGREGTSVTRRWGLGRDEVRYPALPGVGDLVVVK